LKEHLLVEDLVVVEQVVGQETLTLEMLVQQIQVAAVEEDLHLHLMLAVLVVKVLLS
jgi:hypothetical protein